MPQVGRMAQQERIRLAAACLITGLTTRTLQSLAIRAIIPGAAKLGGSWTFDVAKLRNWIAEQETHAINRAKWADIPYRPLDLHLASPDPKEALSLAYDRVFTRRK